MGTRTCFQIQCESAFFFYFYDFFAKGSQLVSEIYLKEKQVPL